MTVDPIVEEVHRIREEILAEYGGDLNLLIADAQRRTEDAVRAGRQVLARVRGPVAEENKNRKVG